MAKSVSQLAQFQSDDQPFQLMQSSWAAAINPLLANPSLQCRLIKGVALINGVTVINHRLGRLQQGWRIVDIDGAAAIYRSQPLSDLTLTLTSNAAVTVSLEVF